MSETKKGKPGRPSNFPGQETELFVTKLPVATRSLIFEYAEKRECTIGQAADILIRRAYRDMARKAKKPAKADA